MKRNRFDLCCLLIVGTLAAAWPAHAAEIPSGLWSGGYGALEGKQPQWHTIIADVEVDGGRIEGTLRRGGEIEGRVNDGVVTLSIKQNGRKVQCEGRPAAGALMGTCSGGSEPFTLQIVFEQEPSPGTLEKMAGVYVDEDGGQIAIEKSIHLVLTDFHSGAYRALYAVGPDRFVAGERIATPLPTALRVEFERDDSGNVSGLSIKGADGSVRRARRCCSSESEEFTFTNDGVTLAGSLHTPTGPGPHPAAVYVHGSGKQTRAGAGTWPQYLVARGFAVLAYDKRGQGSSGGRYELPGGGHDNQPHMQRRSTDVLAAVRALQERDDIDSDQVGLIGGSQAGWVMPMAAEHGGVAFTIALSGGATELSVEGRFSDWADENGSGGAPIDDVIARLRKYKPRDYDFRPHFAAQKAPGLWLYGGMDRSNPSVLCIELLQQVRKQTGNDFTIRYFPDGNHGLLSAVTGGAAESMLLGRSVSGLYQAVDDWLDAKGFGPRSATAAAETPH